MKKINVETLVPDTFKFLARDMDGKLYAFENEPSVATDIACDTWDVKEGEILHDSNINDTLREEYLRELQMEHDVEFRVIDEEVEEGYTDAHDFDDGDLDDDDMDGNLAPTDIHFD